MLLHDNTQLAYGLEEASTHNQELQRQVQHLGSHLSETATVAQQLDHQLQHTGQVCSKLSERLHTTEHSLRESEHHKAALAQVASLEAYSNNLTAARLAY